LTQNLCVLRPYANERVLEGFTEAENYFSITKEESDALMTKTVVTQDSNCYIFILTIIYGVD